MTVSPELPLEIVMQIFKRLGSVNQSVFIGTKAHCFQASNHSCRGPWSTFRVDNCEGRPQIHCDRESRSSTIVGRTWWTRWPVGGDMDVDKSTDIQNPALERKDPSGLLKKITNKWFLFCGDLESKSK